MVIDFSTIGTVREQPVLVLCNTDGTAIQTLGYAFGLKAEINYNEMSTITFEIPAYANGMRTPHYDDITGMRIIDMIGWGRFILMNPSVKNDGMKEIKSCKAHSLEYELTYKKSYLSEGTYNFWDPFSPKNTVLGMLMNDLPSWSVGAVDDTLIGKYRTLSNEDANSYNFIKSTLQQTYGCIFDFNTYTRTINVRSTENESGLNPIYISLNNLAKEIEITEDTENLFTVLDVNGGENVDIRSVNPLGTNKIYNLDYFMNTSYFSQELIDKWTAWKKSFESNQLTYYNISVERTLKTSAILTEQATLSNFKNVELAKLQNEKSVYVEFLAKLADKNSAEYKDFQKKLNDVNKRIDEANSKISNLNNTIDGLKSEESKLEERLIDIQKNIAFENFFTKDELIILDRYFKEDSIEESSFVVSEVDSYSDSDISTEISNTRILFENCSFNKIHTDSTSSAQKTIYTLNSGSVSIEGMKADVVSASIEINKDNEVVLSAFLNKGKIEDKSFPSACLSVTGINATIITTGTSKVDCTVGTGNMYFTRNTTDYERYSVSWDLYEYGKETLNSLSYPSYSFDVSSANFMNLKEFKSFVNQLELGQKIYLNTDHSILHPIFIGLTIDFENLSSLSLSFSDKYSSSDNAFKIVDLLDQSISMGKSVNANKLSYSSFVNSGASTKVKEFMDSALDVAKNAILSSSGQGVSWDTSGLHLRKYLDDENPEAGFEDEQIWMINNSIVFTDDNWKTAKMAIGKVIDENIAKYAETADKTFVEGKTYYFIDKDNDGRYQVWNGSESDWAERPQLYEKDITAYGIVAPYIVGTILAGQNLTITTEDGSFKVDSSGVHINSMKFHITQDKTGYETTLGKELQDLKHQDIESAQNIASAVEKINGLTQSVNSAVTIYYQSNEPKDAKEGDLWYVSAADDTSGLPIEYMPGKLYRCNGKSEENGKVIWIPITDPGITDAIAKAENAKATADGKITSYYQNYVPANPNFGDLWFNTADVEKGGSFERCIEVGDNLSGITLNFKAEKLLASSYYISPILKTANENYEIGVYNLDGKDMLSVVEGNTHYKIYDCIEKKLLKEELTLSSRFGQVTEIDKRNPFYAGIVSEFKNEYNPKMLYRYDGSKWVEVQDGDIGKVKENVDNISGKLNNVIEDGEGGAKLKAETLTGLIDATQSSMKNGTGNVLFDEYGIWLMNAAQKTEATKAVWMNDQGIMIGSGKEGEMLGKDEDGKDLWSWQTAISAAGIATGLLATKELNAFKINGGSIEIGSGNSHFSVDTNGNLIAVNGNFSGNISASNFTGELKGDNNSWLVGCGIKIGEIKPPGDTSTGDNDKYNFYVDREGNVTMKGNINMSGGKITWSGNNTPVQAQYSTNGREGVEGNWHESFDENDYYVKYSYDGGETWTGAIPVRGQNGQKGDPGEQGARGPKGDKGDDATVDFEKINYELGHLFKDIEGKIPTTISDTYMFSPKIKSGEFYGCNFYAGSPGKKKGAFTNMNANGLSVYTSNNGNESDEKIRLGYYDSDSDWKYPYLRLGVGTGSTDSAAGVVMKLGEGIWIGDSSIIYKGGDYPGGKTTVLDISTRFKEATGIFIDFKSDQIYRYYKGVPVEIGSGTATFG